jgi:hypothetical protein
LSIRRWAKVTQPRSATKSTTYYSNGGFNLINAVLVDPNNPSAGGIPFMRQYVAADNLVTSYTGADDYAWYVQDRWRE